MAYTFGSWKALQDDHLYLFLSNTDGGYIDIVAELNQAIETGKRTEAQRVAKMLRDE